MEKYEIISNNCWCWGSVCIVVWFIIHPTQIVHSVWLFTNGKVPEQFWPQAHKQEAHKLSLQASVAAVLQSSTLISNAAIYQEDLHLPTLASSSMKNSA